MKFSTRDLATIPLFTALMIVGAKISIPTPLVVITFQLFFCMYAGLLLGARNALVSQLLYVVLGLIGLPVFASGGGMQYVVNPTFGYIIGFVICAWSIGLMVDRTKKLTLKRALLICIPGFIAVYIIGNTYFWVIYNQYLGKAMSYFAVWGMMLIYMIKDFVLTMIAAYTATLIVPKINQSR